MILGPNGSGKSTLLRTLAGLTRKEEIKSGFARVNEPRAFVFQNPDHQVIMPTVAHDVAFGLRRKQNDASLPRLSNEEIEEKVRKTLKMVNMLKVDLDDEEDENRDDEDEDVVRCFFAALLLLCCCFAAFVRRRCCCMRACATPRRHIVTCLQLPPRPTKAARRIAGRWTAARRIMAPWRVVATSRAHRYSCTMSSSQCELPPKPRCAAPSVFAHRGVAATRPVPVAR